MSDWFLNHFAISGADPKPRRIGQPCSLFDRAWQMLQRYKQGITSMTGLMAVPRFSSINANS